MKHAYEQAFNILRLPAVKTLSVVILTRALAFSAAETLTQHKLLERGIPKQHLAIISACMTPVSLATPLLISRWTGSSRPLDCVVRTWMSRAILALGASVAVLLVPSDEGIDHRCVTNLLWLPVTLVHNIHFVEYSPFCILHGFLFSYKRHKHWRNIHDFTEHSF